MLKLRMSHSIVLCVGLLSCKSREGFYPAHENDVSTAGGTSSSTGLNWGQGTIVDTGGGSTNLRNETASGKWASASRVLAEITKGSAVECLGAGPKVAFPGGGSALPTTKVQLSGWIDQGQVHILTGETEEHLKPSVKIFAASDGLKQLGLVSRVTPFEVKIGEPDRANMVHISLSGIVAAPGVKCTKSVEPSLGQGTIIDTGGGTTNLRNESPSGKWARASRVLAEITKGSVVACLGVGPKVALPGSASAVPTIKVQLSGWINQSQVHILTGETEEHLKPSVKIFAASDGLKQLGLVSRVTPFEVMIGEPDRANMVKVSLIGIVAATGVKCTSSR